MRITIETDVETARIAAALAEIKREGAQRKALYPKWVAGGKLPAAEARRRLLALADACRVIQAVLAEVEPLPFFAGEEGDGRRETGDGERETAAGAAVPPRTAGERAQARAAMRAAREDADAEIDAGRTAGAAVKDEAPRCRFCGRPGTKSLARSADTWTCANPGCMGGQGFVAREIFGGNRQAGGEHGQA